MNESKPNWTGPEYEDPMSLPVEDRPFVDFRKTRSHEQRLNYSEIIEAGVCPFCAENREEFMDVDFIAETEHWVLTRPGFPHEGAQEHFMAFAQYHAESVEDMKPGAWDELFSNLFSDLIAQYDIDTGGIAMRFGNIFKNNGASVRHLHVHLYKNYPEKDPQNRLKFKISG